MLFCFKRLSLRAVREFLFHKDYKVSIETIREWFHAVGRALQTVHTIAIWVYLDETKIKARNRTYYLWLAVNEKGLPVFAHLSRKRDSWTASLALAGITFAQQAQPVQPAQPTKPAERSQEKAYKKVKKHKSVYKKHEVKKEKMEQ